MNKVDLGVSSESVSLTSHASLYCPASCCVRAGVIRGTRGAEVVVDFLSPLLDRLCSVLGHCTHAGADPDSTLVKGVEAVLLLAAIPPTVYEVEVTVELRHKTYTCWAFPESGYDRG